jgi:hypothetical protein
LVRKGQRLRDAELSLDFRFGFFEPGATDEGDGGSEIELDVDLGGGAVSVRMTRNVDPVTFGTVAGRNALDRNADKAADDVDLRLGSRDFLSLEGAGSGDELLGSDDPPFSSAPLLPFVAGGEGADLLRGGFGPDALFGGLGPDRIDAGPGRGFIAALGDCERVVGPKELGGRLRSRAAASRGLGVKVISRRLGRWRDRVGR